MPKCSASNPWYALSSPEVLGCELPMSNSDETLFSYGKNTHIANHPFDGTRLSLESPREAACFFCQKIFHSLHMKNGPRWFASNRRPKLLLAVRNLPHFIMITSHIHPLSLDGCFSFEEITGCQMRASGGGGEEGGWDEFLGFSLQDDNVTQFRGDAFSKGCWCSLFRYSTIS